MHLFLVANIVSSSLLEMVSKAVAFNVGRSGRLGGNLHVRCRRWMELFGAIRWAGMEDGVHRFCLEFCFLLETFFYFTSSFLN